MEMHVCMTKKNTCDQLGETSKLIFNLAGSSLWMMLMYLL